MKNLIKRALIGVLAGVMLITSPAVAKASDNGSLLREKVQKAFEMPPRDYDGTVIEATDYNGADFVCYKIMLWDDELVKETDPVYIKIVDDSTVEVVGWKYEGTGKIYIDGSEINDTYGIKLNKVIVDSFKGDKNLKYFKIEDIPKVELKKNGFKDCTNLEAFSASIINLPEGVFKNCKKMDSNIFINANTTSKIGKSAFENSGVPSITINNAHKFKSFGESAFKNCRDLEEIELISPKFKNSKSVLKYYKNNTKIKINKQTFKGAGSAIKQDVLFHITWADYYGSYHYGFGNDCSDFANGKLPDNFWVSYTDPDGYAENR